MRKNIAVVTGSRAEYGLLRNLLFLIRDSHEFNLKLFVTGMHLSKKYGNTFKEIINDNIEIFKKINIRINSDDPLSISSSTSIGINKFAKSFKDSKIDLLIILGDRYELLGAVIPACFENIPIAHIHGGETTEGVLDEAIRHSITKFSSIHFVANEVYRRRVIQLGESPSRVFNVGGMGIDAIASTKLLSLEEIQKKLKIKIRKKSLLVTYHPETLKRKNTNDNLNELILSLTDLEDTTILITLPNADPDNLKIISCFKKFANNNPNVYLFKSLGQINYFSLLSLVDGVLGNSSSGLLEAPYFCKGTINIGDRQRGRLKANSVIDCLPNAESISKALSKLYSKKFKEKLHKIDSPYGKKGASKNIYKILKKLEFDNLIQKKFFDVDFNL